MYTAIMQEGTPRSKDLRGDTSFMSLQNPTGSLDESQFTHPGDSVRAVGSPYADTDAKRKEIQGIVEGFKVPAPYLAFSRDLLWRMRQLDSALWQSATQIPGVSKWEGGWLVLEVTAPNDALLFTVTEDDRGYLDPSDESSFGANEWKALEVQFNKDGTVQVTPNMKNHWHNKDAKMKQIWLSQWATELTAARDAQQAAADAGTDQDKHRGDQAMVAEKYLHAFVDRTKRVQSGEGNPKDSAL